MLSTSFIESKSPVTTVSINRSRFISLGLVCYRSDAANTDILRDKDAGNNSSITTKVTCFAAVPSDILHILADKFLTKTELMRLRSVCCDFNLSFTPYLYRILVQEIEIECRTHLHRAVSICLKPAIQHLLVACAPVNFNDRFGETALHVAARSGCLQGVEMLLHGEADVNAKSQHDWTPLHLTARHGHVPVLQKLIDAGADINIHGFHGWTALHYAGLSGSVDVAEILLSAGANIHAVDNDRKPPLEVAKILPESQAAQ